MYSFLTTTEKALGRLKSFSKLSYYKLKYGKRLKVGKGVHFRKGLIINISRNGKVVIGDGTFFNNYCSINCHNKIVIGKNNLFGEGVKIYDHNHVFNDKSVNMKKSFRDGVITIGSKNWFGSNVIVLSKAKIGDNNVFGANTVLNSEFGSGVLVKCSTDQKTEKIVFKESSDE